MTSHIGQRITTQFDSLTAQEQRVTSVILDHFDDFAVYSAADLSRLTGVSKSTVSRLFKRLGFESFRCVKAYARQRRHLGIPLVIDATAMEESKSSLARQVVVMGFRNSYPLAEGLVDLTHEDIVVLFGLRRRPKALASLVDTLERTCARTLLIADSSGVNFASQLRWFLETPLESISAFDSYATANSLIAFIANAVLHQRLVEGRERISTIGTRYTQLDELEYQGFDVE